MKKVHTAHIALTHLVPAGSNANVMSAEAAAQLAENMRIFGPNLQPVLVVPNNEGMYLIVDGHHRVEAAREAGFADILCTVVDLDENERALLGLSMNRLRGEIDLSIAAGILAEMRKNDPAVELSPSGFTEDELTMLLAAQETPEVEPEMLPDEMGSAPEPTIKPFLLELEFANRADLTRVKRALRRAAGKGGELSSGLLRLIDGA